VLGEAIVEGGGAPATFFWSYREGGRIVRSESPPSGLRLTQIRGSAAQLMIKLPADFFAIRTPDGVPRLFETPLRVETTEKVTCSCRARPDCRPGKSFRCTAEGYLDRR